MLLLSSERTVLTLLEYENYTPENFIDQIKTALHPENINNEYTAKAKLMGTAFEFIVIAPSPKSGKSLLNQCITEVHRIEELVLKFRWKGVLLSGEKEVTLPGLTYVTAITNEATV